VPRYDVAVVGGGPAGCAAARQIAAAGCRVAVLEEHRHIGEPLQCAGLISPRTLELSGYQGLPANELHGFTLHSPNGYTLGFTSAKTYAVVIDRVDLDRQLAARATAAGAELLAGVRVSRLQDQDEGVTLHGTRPGRSGDFTLEARLVIAADGARSRIARQLGLLPRETVTMAAAEIKLGLHTGAPDDTIQLFLGEDLAPGWFGWLFPAGDGLARIGVGVGRGRTSPRACLQRLMQKYPAYFAGAQILRYTGGSVPIGPPERLYAGRVLLLGDAAAQVKPMSGGGLYLGLNAAAIGAQVAVQALASGDCSADALAAYQQAWEKEYGSTLNSDLVLRELFLSLNESKMDYLTRFFNNNFWRQLIAGHADIDYPSQLITKLLSTGLLPRRFFKLALDLGGFIGRRGAGRPDEQIATALEK